MTIATPDHETDPWTTDRLDLTPAYVRDLETAAPAVEPAAPPASAAADKLPEGPVLKRSAGADYTDPIPLGPVADKDLRKLLKVAISYKKGRLAGTLTLSPQADREVRVEIDVVFCGRAVTGSMRFRPDGREDYSSRYLRGKDWGEVTMAARDTISKVAGDLAAMWGRAHPEAFVAAARRDAESDLARAEGKVREAEAELERLRSAVAAAHNHLRAVGGPLPTATGAL